MPNFLNNPIPPAEADCGSNTVTPSYDYELACFDDGAGNIVTGFVVADQNAAPPGGLTFWVNGADVTASHTIVQCEGEAATDFELLEKCFRDISDPSVTFTRVTAVDANLNVLSTVWFDTNGVAVPAPLNVEACADDVYPKNLGTVLGCLDRNCATTLTTETFTPAEFLLQTVLAQTGTVYTIQYDFATLADATRFFNVQQLMSTPGARADVFGVIFYHPGLFVSGTQTGTSVTIVFDVSQTFPADDAATGCGHVEGDYFSTVALLQGFWDSVGVGNSEPGNDFTVNVTLYTGGPTTVQITKFEIAENVFQDKIFLPPRTPGDPLVELTGLEIGETLNLGGCADVAAQTVLCAGTETIMGGADPASNNFLNVMAPVVADNLGMNAALIGNSGDGLIIDGTPWVFNVPTAQEVTLTVPDLESFDYVQDSASNQWLFGGPVTLDLTVDPTAVGFVAALQTEIQNAYLASGFAPSAVTTVTIVTINPGVNVVIQIVTENVPLSFDPVFMQFLHQTNGNTYGFSDYRRGWETNYQFSATLPPGATLTSVSFEVDYELFDPANLNEIFLGACLPSNTILLPAGDQYAFDGALSVGPTTVTYSPGLTGTNSITNLPYTIDANSLLDIGCWVYWGEFGHGQINVDGVRMRYTYTLPIEGAEVPVVAVCQGQINEIVDAINTVRPIFKWIPQCDDGNYGELIWVHQQSNDNGLSWITEGIYTDRINSIPYTPIGNLLDCEERRTRARRHELPVGITIIPSGLPSSTNVVSLSLTALPGTTGTILDANGLPSPIVAGMTDDWTAFLPITSVQVTAGSVIVRWVETT